MTKTHNCQATIITDNNGQHLVEIEIVNGKLTYETTSEAWEADLIEQPPQDPWEKEVLRLAKAAGLTIGTIREPEWNE